MQPHSDAQFHAVNFAEINNYTTSGNGNSCAVITATGNNAPTANAGADYTIPMNTPFFLIGTGVDADNDALTFSWEEIDVFGAIGDWNAPQTVDIPLFRSFVPTVSATRYFPKISDVINGTTTIGERLPSIARTMNFRLTVRDNKAGGGGICFDDAVVTTNATGGGSFKISYPNATGIIWLDGETKTITWNKVGTDAAPFNVANVAIELSIDGGNTYPISLLASTANDGSENIIVPVNYTTTARVRIRAIGNIFYTISSNNFTIKVNPQPVKWLQIIAQKEKEKTIKILWTVNEIANSFYEVERSIDGDKFYKIGTVNALQNTTSINNYSFIDAQPFAAKNYYRIKQVDKNGSFTYSKIVNVNMNETIAAWVLYPNPANAKINLFCNANSNNVTIEMFDAIGKMVQNITSNQITKGQSILIV